LTAPPTSSHLVCCDLDGVVWRGDDPIPGAAGGIEVLRAAGMRVVFLTNNSSGRVGDVVAKLERHGVPTAPADVASSAQAAAAFLAQSMPAGSKVLACAGPGVVDALTESGFEVFDASDPNGASADAVVVGWHQNFDFERMRRAADVARAGARFVATNLDPTYPGANGLLPGAGSIVAAVATASGRTPEVAGKPEAPMAALVRERYGAATVMIGDRISTDGDFATALGCPFALVLSGIVGTDGGESMPDPPPRFVAADLGVLAPQLVSMFAGDTSGSVSPAP
jgi:4-nitrophenyl phosphatase